MDLADARGFMFDLDGTLIRPSRDGIEVLPGAVEVLEAIHRSGRPLVIFTNASHTAPARIAERLRRAGLPVADDEVMTAMCSTIGHLERRHSGQATLAITTPEIQQRLTRAGVRLADREEARRAAVVLVANADHVDMELLEDAAFAVMGGAAFLTTNRARAYAGADGPILSRGAMLTAAIAKASARRAQVTGKPSRAGVREVADRLGVAPRDVVFVGDDVHMDIALGHLAGARTVLVRTGTTGGDLDGVPERRRPHLVLDGVDGLLERL